MKPLFYLLLTLPLLATLSGCPGTGEPTLRVGSTVWPGYETLYIAREHHHFEGHDIHLVEMASGTEVMHALRSGNLEAAALTLDEALRLTAEGLPLRVALIFNFSSGGDALVVAPHVTGLEDLTGRRIGIETGAIGALMFAALLRETGLEADAVERVHLSTDQSAAALTRGDVDAVVTYEPYLSHAVREGGQVVFDSRSIRGKIVDVLVVREDRVERLDRPLRALLDGHFRALELLERDPEAAARLMQPRLRLDTAAILASLEGLELPGLEDNHRWLSSVDGLYHRRLQSLQDFLLEAGLLHAPGLHQPRPDPRWLPEAEG